MENENKGFGYFFDKSLKTLKNNLFVLVPNFIFYIVMGAISLAIIMPLMKGASNNPYMLMNKFQSNPGGFVGSYFLFLFAIIAFSLFVESGNMYMIRNVIKGQSNGLSDFMGGLTKYPHKLLGFGLLMILVIICIEIVLAILFFIAFKIGTFLAVIIGIAAFVLIVFLSVVFQPYDAVMAIGDNGPIETISKTLKFGKSNFLTLFILIFVVFIISLLFQGAASVTTGVSSIGASMSANADFSSIPFIIVYSIQMIISLILSAFSRIFKFHLYQENSGHFDIDSDKDVLNDYISNDFTSNTSETKSTIDITKPSDSNVDLSKSDDSDKK
ncbi:MAG: hypothetical protein WBA54_02140 [Acidaminobacteraceae bacterium]